MTSTDRFDRRTFVGTLGTAGALALAGCLGDDDDDADGDDAEDDEDTVEILLQDGDLDAERGDGRFEFDPAEITVDVGTTVIWRNAHNTPHTVTTTDSLEDTPSHNDGKFDERLDSEGDTFEYTFEEPGETLYYCRPHPVDMQGSVTVE